MNEGRGGTIAIVAAAVAIVGAIGLVVLEGTQADATSPPSSPSASPSASPSTAPAPGPSALTPTLSHEVGEGAAPAASPSPAIDAPPPTTELSAADAVREAHATADIRAAIETNPDHALELIDAADLEFGEGSFFEEREALRVLALAAGGHTVDARRLGALYLEEHPHALYADRVRRAIAHD